MVIGIILGAIVGGFLFLGGLGVYIWESITGIPGMALEAQVPDEDPERIERHGNL